MPKSFCFPSFSTWICKGVLSCLMKERAFLKEPGCFIGFALSTTIWANPKCFSIWTKNEKNLIVEVLNMQVTYTQAGFLAHSPKLFFPWAGCFPSSYRGHRSIWQGCAGTGMSIYLCHCFSDQAFNERQCLVKKQIMGKDPALSFGNS